jgi:hypothetical protein
LWTENDRNIFCKAHTTRWKQLGSPATDDYIDQILTIVWHLLANPNATYRDLGADYYAGHINTQRKIRNHVRQLEALGLQVTLTPAAA